MFILKSKQQLTKAIENARALHPKVRMVEFGEYEVSGSKGNTYTVLCYRANGARSLTATARRGSRANTLRRRFRFTSTWPPDEATK